jgi:hypothetical protein
MVRFGMFTAVLTTGLLFPQLGNANHPLLPKATWAITAHKSRGQLIINKVTPAPGTPARFTVQGSCLRVAISGFYDRRTGKLWFLRGADQVYFGDLNRKDLSLSGTFQVISETGKPAQEGRGYPWRATLKEKKRTVVPFLYGLPLPRAQKQLIDAGLRYKIAPRNRNRDTPGVRPWVNGQSIAAGKEVARGTIITLHLSTGYIP